MFRCTSVIRRVPGSAGQTKIQMVCYDNTCRRPLTYPDFRSPSWTRSLCVSIRGHDKRWDFALRRIDCRLVLLRPLDTTRLPVSWAASVRESHFTDLAARTSPILVVPVLAANSLCPWDET